MVETFEPFDLKITKLTGRRWDRQNLRHLAEQFFEGQGKPRKSIENRIVLCFDGSTTSDIEFLRANERVLINSLLGVVDNPYQHCYWLDKFKCWCALVLIEKGEYYETEGLYYEHPVGNGLREPDKAKFERYILQKVAEMRRNSLRLEPNLKVHGIDAYIKLDKTRLTH